MDGMYHQIYQKYGIQRSKTGNFHCWNKAGHEGGTDNTASLSIDNQTGVHNCHGCDMQGNFQTFYTQHLKMGDVSYTDFVIDELDIDVSHIEKSIDKINTKDYAESIDEFHKQMKIIIGNSAKNNISLSDAIRGLVKDTIHMDMSIADGYVENLLSNQEKMDYLFETRNADKDLIRDLKIGWDPVKTAYTIPNITADGHLKNIVLYNPFRPDHKWTTIDKNRGRCPYPYSSFSSNRVYAFEGYPDMITAKSFGYAAFTLGPANVTNIEREFGGESECRRLFSGKEVIIVYDDDPESAKYVAKVAEKYLKYADQVKSVLLRKSDINPNGLDITLTKDVGGKKKQVEKDFTDFMVINGFDENAKYHFDKLVDNTAVWTVDHNRTGSAERKITLAEAQGKKYNSNHKKRIRITTRGNIIHKEDRAYQYPHEVSFSCYQMNKSEPKLKGKCATCSLPRDDRFGRNEDLSFKFERSKDKEEGVINVSEKDILNFVETPEDKRNTLIKRLAKVTPSCPAVDIEEDEVGELMSITLISPSLSDYEAENVKVNQSEYEAFLSGYCDIEPNRTYEFEGYQATSPKSGHSVLFLEKATPVETPTDSFEMTEEANDILLNFKPRDGESIEEYFRRRYTNFGVKAGLQGREDLFFLTDLAFFSTPELVNDKIFPGKVNRGFIEILHTGHTRTGKTFNVEAAIKRYKQGDFVSCSNGVSRSGLVGGINTTGSGKTNKIVFGKFVTNDKKLLVLDEFTDMDDSIYKGLVAARSSGKVQIVMSAIGDSPARARKIFIANQREIRGQNIKDAPDLKGMNLLLNVAMMPQHLSRFDAASISRVEDVTDEEKKRIKQDIKDGKIYYNPDEFTDFMCQTHIQYAWSRGRKDFIWEDGIEEYIDELCLKMYQFFSKKTLLVNEEMPLKFMRFGAAIALLVYSHHPLDRNKVYIKKEHVEYAFKFLKKLYTHPNMSLDTWSDRIWESEDLGDMSFMENIMRYIDVSPLLREERFSQNSVQSIFFEYLAQVSVGGVYLPSFYEDNKVTGLRVNESIHNVISHLVSSNAMSRDSRNALTITQPFQKWLEEKYDHVKLHGTGELSQSLEIVKDEQVDKILEMSKKHQRDSLSKRESSEG